MSAPAWRKEQAIRTQAKEIRVLAYRIAEIIQHDPKHAEYFNSVQAIQAAVDVILAAKLSTGEATS